MKNIISAVLFIAISIFTTELSAQQMAADQLKNFQTDNLSNLKNTFTEADFNKCFNLKDKSVDLLTLSVNYERKNNFDFLIGKTTDIDRACGNENALMKAARYGRTEMAKQLLKKGASKSLKNSNGETAKEIALKNNHAQLAKIL